MIAITRPVSPTLAHCELSHLEREPMDVDRAAYQHARYEDTLESLGCEVVRLPAAPDRPDAVFVEDTAVVVEEMAIVARPGAESRRGEVGAVAEALAGLRPIRRIQSPGTLEGGDVLRVGRRIWVGVSGRTNHEGAEQLRAALGPLGYEVEEVVVEGCLHLKTAATALSEDTLLLNPEWVDRARFAGYKLITVDPVEPFAANVLRVGSSVVMPTAHPRTRDRVIAEGTSVVEVEVSELAKAEAGVTCCCILMNDGER